MQSLYLNAEKNTLIWLFVFCCNHNFFCTFQKSSSIGEDRHSDGDADLPVHCDVILHGADAGRNDGASLVWGCKFFYAFVTYCVTTCSNYELLFHLFSEALTGGNIQKEPKNACIVREI